MKQFTLIFVSVASLFSTNRALSDQPDSAPGVDSREPSSAPVEEYSNACIEVISKSQNDAEGANKTYIEGNKKLLQGDAKGSIALFNKCLRQDHKLIDCYRGLGIAFSRLNKNELGEKCYKKYLALRKSVPAEYREIKGDFPILNPYSKEGQEILRKQKKAREK
jgi:hypothetical protein